MKNVKRKKMKNPKKLHVDNFFINLLCDAILDLNSEYISNALVYLKLGFKKCKDCSLSIYDRDYKTCICESCLNENDKNCNHNYCICKLLEENNMNVIKTAVYVAKKYLNKNQILQLKNKLKSIIIPYYENHKIDRVEFALQLLN